MVIEGFSRPADIAVNSRNGKVWIANTWDNSIVMLRDGIENYPQIYNISQHLGWHLILTGYIQPTVISIDEQNGNVWFAEQFRVVKVKWNESSNTIDLLKEVPGFNSPRGIIVNPGVQ